MSQAWRHSCVLTHLWAQSRVYFFSHSLSPSPPRPPPLLPVLVSARVLEAQMARQDWRYWAPSDSLRSCRLIHILWRPGLYALICIPARPSILASAMQRGSLFQSSCSEWRKTSRRATTPKAARVHSSDNNYDEVKTAHRTQYLVSELMIIFSANRLDCKI